MSAKGRDALVRTNFTWVVDATQQAARRMAAGARGGSIVTITSIEAHRAAPGYAVYAAMKAAVTHLTRTLAVELGAAGIRVNCVAPDFVPTAGLAGVAGRAGSAGQRAAAAGDGTDPGDFLTIPLRRKGEVTDVGNCVLFLASDLSSYITGTTLHPDGGALAASGWMDWPDEGFTARPPAWVLDRLEPPTRDRSLARRRPLRAPRDRPRPHRVRTGAVDARRAARRARCRAGGAGRGVDPDRRAHARGPTHRRAPQARPRGPAVGVGVAGAAGAQGPARRDPHLEWRTRRGLGRALRVRLQPTGAEPFRGSGPVPGIDPGAPPGPDAGYRSPAPIGDYRAFHNTGAELLYVVGHFAKRGPATVWVRLAVPVVPGEEPSPLQRVAAASDFGNGVSSELDFARHIFINPDLTVYVHRPALGEWVCLDASTTIGIPGVGLAESRLWDVHGPIGRSLQSLLVEPRP